MSAANRCSRIILIYSALGPPIGGLLVWLHLFGACLFGDALFDSRTALTPGYILAWVYGLLAIPLLGYLFGGVQAFLTGCLLKWASNAIGGFSYVWAAVAPLIVGAIAGGWIVYDGGAPVDGARVSWALYLTALGVASSLILRYFFRSAFSAGRDEN